MPNDSTLCPELPWPAPRCRPLRSPVAFGHHNGVDRRAGVANGHRAGRRTALCRELRPLRLRQSRRPQGRRGSVRRRGQLVSDSTNLFLGTKGTPAVAVASAYESLFTSSLDEVDISATYPLLAEAMRYPSDFAWAEYRLDPRARWQDGEPVTVDDVIWSFDTLKEIYPLFTNYYNHVVKAEPAGERTVRFIFDAPGNRELPHILGQLYVLPKHWWQGKDESGKPRNIRETTLEAPLGSGPYKVTAVDVGRRVTLVRDADYWGRDAAGRRWNQQLRPTHLRLLRRPHRADGGLQGRQVRFPVRTLGQDVGRPATTSRRRTKARS